jgi:GNAT superfamily N-acetyltransferase
MAITVERLSTPVSPSDLHSLADLLCDAVNSGSAVSFLAPLDFDTAETWWRETLSGADAKKSILVARQAKETGSEIVGTVQLHPSWAPNQPHRADIAKLIVHRRVRGQGIGQRLMEAVEQIAAEAGYTLLVLDTRRGCEAENLYRKLGWTEAGVIPDFAVNADGSGLHDTVIVYKRVTEIREAR